MFGQFKTPAFNPRIVVSKAEAYTMLWSDDEIQVYGEYTVTLPSIGDLKDEMNSSKMIKIKNTSTSTVTISCNSLDTIEDGSSSGATSIYLYNQNDYVILQADLGVLQWKLVYPNPSADASRYIKDDSITGIKNVDGKHYHAVSVDTNGTTAVNVFSSAGAPAAMTITGILAVAKDTTAGNISLTNGTAAVAQFAKSTTAGVCTGEDGALANTTVTSADTLTVVSSSTGNARVTITYTIA